MNNFPETRTWSLVPRTRGMIFLVASEYSTLSYKRTKLSISSNLVAKDYKQEKEYTTGRPIIQLFELL